MQTIVGIPTLTLYLEISGGQSSNLDLNIVPIFNSCAN
jgi:hypothetical protein